MLIIVNGSQGLWILPDCNWYVNSTIYDNNGVSMPCHYCSESSQWRHLILDKDTYETNCTYFLVTYKISMYISNVQSTRLSYNINNVEWFRKFEQVPIFRPGRHDHEHLEPLAHNLTGISQCGVLFRDGSFMVRFKVPQSIFCSYRHNSPIVLQRSKLCELTDVRFPGHQIVSPVEKS